MPMVVRARSFASHWWLPLLMGALFGVGMSWFSVRGRARTLRARLKPRHVELDLDALTARVRALPGAEELQVKSFGQGICELVGSAGGEIDVAGLVRALAAEPGVSALVNRVWTPESGGAA